MAIIWPDGIPGAAELKVWYGGFPGFHDASAIFSLTEDGKAFLKIHGYRMTDRVDEKGFFVLEKHFLATFIFEELRAVNLQDFQPGWAILGEFEITKQDDAFVVTFDSSYGFSGAISSRTLRVSFEPQIP